MMKIKSLLLSLVTIFTFNLTIGQQKVIITDDPNYSANASAILDVHSKDNNKGILIPRMSSADILDIMNPADGLMLYDNVTNSFKFYNGLSWTEVSGEVENTTMSRYQFLRNQKWALYDHY